MVHYRSALPGPKHACAVAGTALTTAVAARIPTSDKIDPVTLADELDNVVLDQRDQYVRQHVLIQGLLSLLKHMLVLLQAQH